MGVEKSDPLVSVVMPFLNPGRFFREAIESVLAQRWSRWELLLIDDGSTDGSCDLAKGYAERSSRITLMRHANGENRGASISRNLGIERSSGHFLAFLDADDVWMPEKLERQVALLRAHPEAGMVYGPKVMWNSWNSDGSEAAGDWICDLGVEADQVIYPPRMVDLYLRAKAPTPGMGSVMMRKRLVIETGGFNPDFPNMFDDQVFFYKFLLAYPVYVESGIRDRYRQHPDSTCHAAAREGYYREDGPSVSHRIFLEWFEDYLKNEGLQFSGVARALRAALRPYRHPELYKAHCAGRRGLRKGRRVVRRILPEKISASSWLSRSSIQARFHRRRKR